MMARLTEEMAIARSKQSDLSAIRKLNCWGAELGDVSLLQHMPNVEVLAFSLNKIRTLGDFVNCRRLRELYVRKNEIRDLSEIRHLRHLPDLTSLWLDENPCTHHPQYRMTVLRNLPNLEKLDNVPVQPEEVQEAMRRGVHIPDSDDEGYPQQETYGAYRAPRSSESSPERAPSEQRRHHALRRDQSSDSSEGAGAGRDADAAGGVVGAARQYVSERSPAELSPLSPDEEPLALDHYPTRGGGGSGGGRARSPDDPGMVATAVRHSISSQSVKDYAYPTNGECRYESRPSNSQSGGGGGGVVSPPHHYHEPYCDRTDRSESSPQAAARCAADAWERDREGARAERDRDREYSSAVMAEHRVFTRRPVTRNSNLLSAVLCLVKELDYPSLEVAEMAVRCRMDELANSHSH